MPCPPIAMTRWWIIQIKLFVLTWQRPAMTSFLYSQSTSVWAAAGWLVSDESWNITMAAMAPFNCLLSFCPIDLHCEPFHYTIHHLLNMKNGVKPMLIKPRWKVLCAGPVNQANGRCRLHICMYACCFIVVFLAFFRVLPSILLNPHQQANGGPASLEAGAVN